MGQAKKEYQIFLYGFGITFSLSLFVSFGIYGILFILQQLQSFSVSRNVLIFLTVLLYALSFAIAKAGVQFKFPFNPFKKPEEDDISPVKKPAFHRRQPLIFKALAVLWLVSGVVSVLWLTPAFVIFWFSLHFPHKLIMLCSFIFSMFAAIIYSFARENILPSIKDRILFFSGGCLGVLTAIGIFYFLVNDKILVTWR